MKTRQTADDAYGNALRYVQAAARREQKNIRYLEQATVTLNEYFSALVKKPEVAALLDEIRAASSPRFFRRKTNGEIKFEFGHLELPNTYGRIDDESLAMILATLNSALKPHGLTVKRLDHKLTGWQRLYGHDLQFWTFTAPLELSS